MPRYGTDGAVAESLSMVVLAYFSFLTSPLSTVWKSPVPLRMYGTTRIEYTRVNCPQSGHGEILVVGIIGLRNLALSNCA